MERSTWVGQLFQSIDTMDTDAFLSFLTEDAQFRFGNAQVVIGEDAIRKAVDDFFATIKGLQHRILRTWLQSDTIACQGEVTYTRIDDSRITIPFVNILGMEGSHIKEYLVYIDITPLYSLD